MTAMTAPSTDMTVRRSVTVKTGIDHAFRVFTEGFDTWWPRSHHIGKSPMTRAVIEPFVGGRMYSEQADGTDCPWGQITVWEPPRRFTFAWQITHQWGFEPDLARASEVEVLFTPLPDGSTRVDLEHRHFDRMGEGSVEMRTAVGGEGGWNGLLKLFAERAESR
jgi:activator of Hsp90 ATPase-like protein